MGVKLKSIIFNVILYVFDVVFVVSLATAPGYDHQTAAQVKVSV